MRQGVVALVACTLCYTQALAFVPAILSNRIKPQTAATRLSKAARPTRSQGHVLKAVMQDAARKPVLITGNNIDLTPPLQDYVNKKVDKTLEKLGGVVTKVDVHLNVNRNPRVPDGHAAEVTVFAKGTVIRATETSDNMYASIDLVTDRIARKLRKYKERGISQKRSRASVSETAGELEEIYQEQVASAAGSSGVPETSGDDDVIPHVDMSIVKTKSFPMPPCTVEDAVTALEYIDHDFYVFRNRETNEVNVVYKRNHGGVGLIQPERD